MTIGFLQTESNNGKKLKKGRAKVGGLTERQRKYLKERVKGKNKKMAALLAGYSETTASNPGDRIERPAVREAFERLVARAIPDEKLALRLAEGLDAVRTEFAKVDGQITDFVDFIDFEQRRKYLELAGQWSGRVSTQPALAQNLGVAVKVVIEHIGSNPQDQAPAEAVVTLEAGR